VKKILYVYKWATMGGVERVILNRAHAFKKYHLPVKQYVLFLHDGGGLESFKTYIKKFQLEQHLEVVYSFTENYYDAIFSIDTEEVLGMVQNYEQLYFECHTSYKKNRKYLKQLPNKLGGVIVPSKRFFEEIRHELPESLHSKLFLLRNFVIYDNQQEVIYTSYKKVFNKIPLVYIGRIDQHKNVSEVIDIFLEATKELGDIFLLFIAGPISSDFDLFQVVNEKQISNRFVYLPSIPFEKIPNLLRYIEKNNGIFISASKAESFGLSVAEAIANDVKVLISDIPIHKELVNYQPLFYYEKGNIKDAVKKIKKLIEYNFNQRDYYFESKSKINIENFIEDWSKFSLLL
jgi:glycosyltransferase involved in cell wall biosynthesis